MSVITNGISEITVDGIVLGFTEEDSFSIITDDNTTIQSFNVEEQDDPIFTRITGSKAMSFEFTVADPNAATLTKLFDGTDSSGDIDVAGVSHILQGVPVIVETQMGWGFSITSADVSSRFSDSLGKNSLLGVVVTITINQGFTIVADAA